MTTRYTRINWKEYVSLRRYQNMQWKYEMQKVKCDELEKENKELKNEIWECHWLMDEIDFWKREAKRLWWKPNLMEEDTIKELKDIWEF